MRSFVTKPLSIWSTDRGLGIILALIIADLLVENLPENIGEFEEMSISIVLSLFLVMGAATVATNRLTTWMAASIASITVGACWLNYLTSARWVAIVEVIASLLFYTLFIFVVSKEVFSPGKVTKYKIEGSIAVFILVAMAWAQLFHLAELLVPGSMHFSTTPTSFNSMRRDLVYFALTTLTTSGYGDIVPVSRAVRILAALEAFVGVLYPSILIGRLVSLELDSEDRNKG